MSVSDRRIASHEKHFIAVFRIKPLGRLHCFLLRVFGPVASPSQNPRGRCGRKSPTPICAGKNTSLGPEHPVTVEIRNNLAGLLREQGDLAAARLLY
jgi:hypothetical protein